MASCYIHLSIASSARRGLELDPAGGAFSKRLDVLTNLLGLYLVTPECSSSAAHAIVGSEYSGSFMRFRRRRLWIISPWSGEAYFLIRGFGLART